MIKVGLLYNSFSKKTLTGTTTVSNEKHPKKASSSNDSIEDGKDIFFNLGHEKKASLSIFLLHIQFPLLLKIYNLQKYILLFFLHH